MGADLPKYEIVGTGLRVYFPALKSALIDQPKAPNRQIGGLSGGIDGGLAAKIIELIRADDTVTVSEMAESLGIPKRTIEREMKRAIIIGSPGAGKSTFARQVRDITGLPLYYLDMIWHLPDRTTITKDEFDQKLMDILKTNTWIIDGNYGRTIEMRLKYCDTVFLLDYPLEVCLAGAKARVGKKREEIPWVEEEFDEEFRQWIIDFPETELPRIYGLLEQYGAGKEIHIFRSREDANKYLEGING